MTDFNQKTHDTDVGSHGGQSRQMMLGSFFENENGSRLYFFRPKSGETNLSRR